MGADRAGYRSVTLLLAIVGGLLPLVLYWFAVARAPAINPEEARVQLTKTDGRAVLVDIRTPEEYAAGHLEGARHWPFENIRRLATPAEVPAELRGKQLLLICSSGIRSGIAALRLAERGVQDVFSVRGGMEGWVASAGGSCAFPLCQARTASGETRSLPSRDSPAIEQWAAVVSGFGFKPLYTLFALLVAVWLRRERASDLAALRWAMWWFFIGENFCALNALVYGEGSLLLEHLHSLGMVICFGLTAFALVEGLDFRLLRLSQEDARCAAIGLCEGCIKGAQTTCGLERCFRFLLPAVAVVAAMPLFAETASISYNTWILGTFYNYSHAGAHQLYEVRFLPVAAVVLLVASLVLLVRQGPRRLRWPKILFSAGAGALGFSLFRWILFGAYQPNLVWFAFWEETTELLFIGTVAFTLWVFRDGLLDGRQQRR